jgi:hypothetical protein
MTVVLRLLTLAGEARLQLGDSVHGRREIGYPQSDRSAIPGGADGLTPTKPSRCRTPLDAHARRWQGYWLLLGSRSLSMLDRVCAGRIGERRLHRCKSH